MSWLFQHEQQQRFPIISQYRLHRAVTFNGSRPVHRPLAFDDRDRIKADVLVLK